MHANVLATATFEEILDDLSSRFIINVPEAEQQSPERICFQVEQAHWFYEDFVRLLQPSLPSFQLKTFSEKIFKHCPLMEQWAHQHERAYANFMQYRFRIPVCGAILLNETLDQCVLVKGWSSKSGWSFPRGKINQDEEFDHCAVREVFEETGYDISPLIKDTYLEATIREQSIRLYIICGVPEDTEFRPQTRKEISQVEWFKLDELPGIKPGTKATGRFYMVVPFVCKLKSALPLIRKEYYRSKGGKPPRNHNNNNSNSNHHHQQQQQQQRDHHHPKASRNNNKKSNNGKKAAPTSMVPPPSPPQDTTAATTSSSSNSSNATPEPSVALKSLLGISAGIGGSNSSSSSTPVAANAKINATSPLPPANKAASSAAAAATAVVNKEEQQEQQSKVAAAPEPSVALKSLLGIQKPSSPDASRSASSTSTSTTPEQSASTENTLLQMLQRAQPLTAPPPSSDASATTQEKQQELHPLLQVFKDAGHEIKNLNPSQPLSTPSKIPAPVATAASPSTTTNAAELHPLIALLKSAEVKTEEQTIVSTP